MSSASSSSNVIDFTPSYRTITATGMSHFSRVSDALAEFIDNSLEALHRPVARKEESASSSTTRRLIDIKVFFDEESIVIADNGGGMNKENIKEFATFALEQDMRSSASKEFISKFGVGAKQAGFFIGDRITISTRRRHESILEFVLDEERLHGRALAHGAVFRDSIVVKDSIEEPAPSDSPMTAFVKTHQREHSHFTVITLHMRPHVSVSMRRSPDIAVSLSKELADIYYFHLKPGHLPNAVVLEERFSAALTNTEGRKGASSSNRDQRYVPRPKPIRGDFCHVVDASEPSLEINVEVCQRGTSAPLSLTQTAMRALGNQPSSRHIRALADVNSAPSRLISEGAYPFRFNLTIPDPKPEEASRLESRTEVRRLARDEAGYATALTCAAVNMTTVEGILFYYPTKAGNPTVPDTKTVIVNLVDDDDASNPDDDAANKGNEAEPSDPMMSVYWQDRLVPETTLNSLPFLPDVKTLVQCEREGIPFNWRQRLRGFLFFGRDFRHISNNKLKFQVDPNMNDWLNDKSRFKYEVTTDPKHLENEFLRWLKFCHEHLDEDCVFSKRDLDMEKKEKFVDKSFFQRMVMGMGGKKVFDSSKTGHLLKLKIDKKSNVIVELLGFVVPVRLPSTQVDYRGTDVEIFCRRYPIEIFGADREYFVPLSALHASKKKCEVSKEDKKNLEKKAADSIEVFTKCGNLQKKVESEEVIVMTAGERIEWLAVQIRDFRKQPVFCLPDAASIKYSIRLDVQKGGQAPIFSHVCKVPMFSDRHSEGIVEEGAAADKFFFFKELCFSAGIFNIRIVIMDGDREIKSFNRVLKVTSPPAASFKVIFPDESIGKPVRLGSPLPDFSIHFFDEYGKKATPKGDFHFCISCPQLVVSCDSIDSEWTFEMSGDEEELEFENGLWTVRPKDSQRLMLSEDNNLFDFTVSSTNFPDSPQTFSLRFIPGVPSILKRLDEDRDVPIEQDDFTLSLSREEPSEAFTLVCLDAFGNRTAPERGAKWTVTADSKGSLEAFAGIRSNPDGATTVQGLVPRISEEGRHKQTMVLTAKEPDHPDVIIPWDFWVVIAPSRRPCGLKIFRGNEDITGQTIQVQVGTTLSNLRLVFVDDSGDDISDVVDGFVSKCIQSVSHSWDQSSGTIGKKKKKNDRVSSSSLSLSDVTIEERISSSYNTDYTVEAILTHLDPLSAAFFIKAIPAEPVGWQILYNGRLHDGILLGDREELTSKICGLCLCDKFGNLLDPITAGCPCPELSIEWDGLDDEGGPSPISVHPVEDFTLLRSEQNDGVVWSIKIPLVVGTVEVWTKDDRQLWEDGIMQSFESSKGAKKLSRLSASSKADTGEAENPQQTSATSNRCQIKCYVVKQAASFEGRIGSDVQIKLSLQSSDQGPSYTSCIRESSLFAGLPHQLLIRCPELGLAEFRSEITARVTSNREIESFEAKFVDIFGNDATVQPIKKCKVAISVRDTELLAKTSSKGNLTHRFSSLKMSKVLSCASGDAVTDSMDLLCSGSFTNSSGGEYSVQPAAISLKIVKSNRVTDMEIKLWRQGGETIASQPIDFLLPSMPVEDAAIVQQQCVLPVDASFDIGIHLSTENGVAFTPGPESFDMVVKFRPFEAPYGSIEEPFLPENYDYRGQSVELSALFSRLSVSSEGGDRLYFRHACEPSDSTGFMKMGLYELTISYKESREGGEYYMKGQKKVCSTLYVLAAAGGPVSLRLSPLNTHVALGGSVGHDIVAEAVDAAGNVCHMSECDSASTVTCKLMSSSSVGNDGGTDHLVLSGSSVRAGLPGLMFGDCQTDGRFLFPSIILDYAPDVNPAGVHADTRGDMHSVELIFEYQGNVNLAPCRIKIEYYSNAAQAALLQQLSDEKDFLLREIADFERRKSEKQKEIQINDAEIQEIKHKLSDYSNDIFSQNSQPTQGSFMERVQMLTDLRSEMEQTASQSRPALKPAQCDVFRSIANSIVSAHLIGMVVDLGFVAEEADAKVLSWAAQQCMSGCVVHDVDDAEKLIDSDCPNVMVIDRSTDVSNASFLSRFKDTKSRLVLNEILMVDLIELPPANEYLRETLFYKIFGNALIFQTKQELFAYVREAGFGYRAPLYSLDGVMMDKSGLVSRMPPALEYVFGQLNVLETAKYKDVMKELTLLRENDHLLPKKLDLDRELNNLIAEEDTSVSVNRGEVQRLEERISAVSAQIGEGYRGAGSSSSSYTKRHRIDSNDVLDLDNIVKRGRR